jgi:SAM-dependent methyltransferase
LYIYNVRDLVEVKERANSYADDLKRLWRTDPFHTSKIERHYQIFELLRRLFHKGCRRLLDVGFGYAEGGLMLNWILWGGEVYGVELSERSLTNTMEFFKECIASGILTEEHILKQLFLIYGNILELKPFQELFDVVLSVDMLASYKETELKKVLIDRMLLHLKHGGYMIITTLSCKDKKTEKEYSEKKLFSISVEEMESILKKYKFSDFSVQRMRKADGTETNTLLAVIRR